MKLPIISFQNFTFKYDSQKVPTLKDINLDIYEGEKVVIVGASGSGKSTLGHCINGLIPFSYHGELQGSIKVNGKETKDSDIFSLSKSTGTVLQDPDGQFIGLSVGEDIAFALENEVMPLNEMKEKVRTISDKIEMADHLDSSVHALSGGQRQRVALGGVLVSHVDILLFDEPLANLDPKTGVHAIELIDNLQKELGTTVVMIEHRLEDVLHRPVDRVIIMEDGRITHDAAPDELLATSALEDANIREPLYIKALKHANCVLDPSMKLGHIDTIDLSTSKVALHDWYKKSAIPAKRKSEETILEVKDLRFGYSENEQTLKNISFKIEKGEMISIIGNNGAGKSTLLRLICGFERKHEGKVIFAGEDITKSSIKERAEKIGMIMQNPNHMISKHMIYEEVALGLVTRGVLEKDIKPRVEHVLDVCGLYRYRNWPISALSFGQRKRVTIASILVLNPDILILDEPTAGQDFYHYTQMMQFFEELNNRGITVIIVTHDMHLMLEYTKRSIVLSDGELLADEASVQIMSDEKIVEEANLKQTSLFELAKRSGIEETTDFVDRYISYDREVRENGRNAGVY